MYSAGARVAPRLRSPPRGTMVCGRTVRTSIKGEKLLEKLSKGYSVSSACAAENIGRRTYYDWRTADPEFASAADEAIEIGIDKLEDEANRRAKGPNGSDTLLIFLLKSRRRAVYGDKVEHTGSFTNTVELVGVAAEDV